MFITFNYYTISLLTGAFLAFISGLVVFINNRSKPENQAWFALTLSTSIWSFGYFYMTVTQNKDMAIFSDQILHYAAIFIPLFYFLLVLIIANKVMQYMWLFIFYTCIAVFFVTVTPSTEFVADVIPKVGFNFAPVPGYLYIYFFIYFCLLVTSGIAIALYSITQTTDAQQKNRLKYTIYFSIVAALGGGSVFATTFFSTIPPYPLILFSLYPTISGYAILRHQLFDVKIVTTQLLTFALWTIILLRMFFAESGREQFANGLLFIFAIILGLFLIKSVKNEIKQRERIENLATELETSNEHLKELDQQKSEFVSLASHQLRGPLTAIKGYASMLLDDDFGTVEGGVREAIEKVYGSTQDLVVVVGDYLDVSRIEQGRMQYDFSEFDMKDLIGTIVTELRPNIERAKLTMNFDYDDTGAFMVHADQGKIKQVIGNIIDNAIKYCPQGGIHVWLAHKPDNKILVTISDTGVGIHPDVLPRLFEKFTRAPDASKTNIMGTGLGLYVARKMIEAHNGRIWAESPGVGKGSSFFIELNQVQ
jgi:signal transduction histidine kinase